MMALFYCFFGGGIADELIEGNAEAVSNLDACAERDGLHMIFTIETRDLETTDAGCVHDIDEFHFPFAHDGREMAAKRALLFHF